MNARTVITHAPNQGAPLPVRGTVGVSTGTGALIIMDAYEVLEFRAQGIRPVVVTAPLGSAERAAELADGAANVRVCVCGDVVPVAGPCDVQVIKCAQCSGVSLAKATDRPNGVVMVPSAWELDRRGSERVDIEGSFADWTVEGLNRNDLRYLSRAFAVLGR